jgi:hypothetical protein
MRIPLPILAAALAIIAAGVATLHISVPAKPASIFINASTLQPGQNITLHLNYMPFNITVAMPYNYAMVCIYFHGTVTDNYAYVWSDWYYAGGGYNVVLNIYFVNADLKDTNVTILVTYDYCPPPGGSAASTTTTATATAMAVG